VSSRRYLIGLAVLAAVAGAAAVLTNVWLFPLYSLNRDDSVYVAMARLIEHGHVTLPAAGHEAFRPWASAVVGDRIVLKYTPPWPTVLALGELLTGSPRAGLAVTAAATAVLTALLATEVLRSRATGLVAGALLVLSPVFVVQSGTYLPYVFQLACGLTFAYLLTSGARLCSTARVVGAGAAIGVAAWARPFDALLVAVPFGAYVLVQTWRARRAGGPVRWSWPAVVLRLVLGTLPALGGMLAYDAVVLGDPLRLPYTVTGSADGFGFGPRGVFAQSTIDFTLQNGVAGTLTNLRWLPGWTAGGIVLVAVAVVGLVRTRGAARWPVAALAVVVPLGYLPFWGPYAMSALWPGLQTFGPFYHLPVVVPLVVFGAAGIVALSRAARGAAARWARPLAVVPAVAMVALTAVAVPDEVSANLSVRDDYRALQRFVADDDLGRAVLLLPWRGDVGFDSTSPFLENTPALDQPVLYAEDRGGLDLDVVDDHPDRALYRLTQELPAGRTTGGTLTLDRLRVETAAALPVHLRIDAAPAGQVAVAYAALDGTLVASHALDTASDADLTWTVAAPGAAAPPTPDVVALPASAHQGVLAVGVDVRSPDRPDSAGRRWERRIAYRVVDGGTRIELLRPGQGWFHGDAPGAGWEPQASLNPVHDLP
jgi:hypothetical protein